MAQILITLLFVYISLSPTRCLAQLQGQSKIDSLLKELPLAVEDSNKAAISANLSQEYEYINPQKGIEFGTRALTLYSSLRSKKGMAFANNCLGINHLYLSETDVALSYFLKTQKLYEELENKKGLAAVTCNIGAIYNNQSDYPKALKYFLQALKLDEEGNYLKYAGNVSNNIGMVYFSQKNFPKALEYFLKSLKIFEELKEKSGISRAACHAGMVYCDGLHNYPQALEYFYKSLQLSDELGDKWLSATTFLNVGVVYSYQKNYNDALSNFERSLKLSEEIGAKENLASCLLHIGSLKIGLITDPEIIAGLKKSEPTELKRISRLPGYAGSHAHPTSLSKKEVLSSALVHLQKCLLICKEINNKRMTMECYESLASAYKLNNNYNKALEASDNFHAIKDSVFSQENKEEILKMSLKNDYDRQHLSDSLKTAEKQRIAAINLQKQKSYTYMGVAGILVLAGFSFFIVKERGKSETARKQSDELLLNILPEEVATELKATGSTTAKHFDNVTVLFTDFVNFTQASENMGPQNLIDELHTCFKAFDEITNKYEIEKIKTIGDAYLAVCGLPTRDPHHAENTVNAAREITAFMENRLAKMGSERTFQVRIGIHSGSVVAGIVGVKKFAYDIWGDTVNTAARMEQNSEAGKINISQTTYELVKDKFTCEYRGEVEVKGKGMMKMYFLSITDPKLPAA